MTPRDSPVPRWVLDTNVVLSALVWPGGTSGRLRLAWQKGLFVPLTCRTTALELVRVLAYPKFRLDASEQHELLADYLPWAEAVRIPQPPPSTAACRDPDDLPFLHLAMAADADALVSGDHDLLDLAPIENLTLLTPRNAVAALSAQREQSRSR